MEREKLSGVLVADKPRGRSSHDMVALARRRLGTRKVGHAGTLDPLASGVLVLLVGEGTKLGAYLTAHTKRYVARVAFGLSTETLDREGAPTASAELPAPLTEELSAVESGGWEAAAGACPRLSMALAAERARSSQVPPAYSAIQIEGRRSYARARAGEVVELGAREVGVSSLHVLGAGVGFVDLCLEVTKGYYVRSLARDLGDRLGVPSHLAELRRTASGPFTLAEARDLAASPVLIPVHEAAQRSLPWGRLTAAGVQRARVGQPLGNHDFEELPPLDATSAWLDGAGKLVAIGSRRSDGFVFCRGFGGA